MNRALLFSGQGAQHVGMGHDLASSMPEIAALYAEADQLCGVSLSTLSFQGPEASLTATAICQPALYVHGYALLTAIRTRLPSFRYEAAAGLSLGEYTAHAAAGTFSFATGLELVHHRATFMEEACRETQGGMLTLLGADAPTAEAIAQEAGLEVANYNCPGQIVLSGVIERVPAALEIAKAKGIRKAIPLKVAGAYHSRLMHSAEISLTPYLQAAAFTLPRVPVPANVTGEVTTDLSLIRQQLAAQVTGSVRWEACVRTLIALGIEEFIELGPGGILAGLLKRIDPTKKCLSIATREQLEEHLPHLST
jgi:[acyl-carrier-protein] S-malonyltransferase